MPGSLAPELRAPDSIQFNLLGMCDDEVRNFIQAARARGVNVQVFGLHEDNARAFWNWQFLPDPGPLPKTRAMLMRACDTRLPAHLGPADLEFIATAIVRAAEDIKGGELAYGT